MFNMAVGDNISAQANNSNDKLTSDIFRLFYGAATTLRPALQQSVKDYAARFVCPQMVR